MGGKAKSRSQLCLVNTEDGRILEVEWDVLRACVVDEGTEAAFVLDSSNQIRSKDDGKWYQLLGERSTLPICLIKPTPIKNLTKLIDDIFVEVKEITKRQLYRKAKENKLWNRFTYMVAALVIAAIVLVFLNGGW